MRFAYAALAAIALVVSGCSPATESGTTTSSPSPSRSAVSPSSSWPPAPVDYGPVTLVTGSDVWTVVKDGAKTTAPDGTTHTRGRFRSRLESADDRVAGTTVATWNTKRWEGALTQWGEVRITTSTGGWVGRYSGIYTAKTFDVISGWYTGTGGNKGLSMYMWEQGSGGLEVTFQALIVPGKPPPS